MANNATYFTRELPYSFDFLVENFEDVGHVPFAHHSLQSTRDDGVPIPMQVVANNFTHIEVSFQDISRGKERE
jgi:phenylpropionate dioxygenase-like ring-hydroxylating dioxygenase large terminal subunit